MAILPKWSSSKLLHCQVQGPHGNVRTKPASTEQLRNSPSIASVFASGVNQQHIERTNPQNAWKHRCLHCGQPLPVDLTIEFLGLGDDRISSKGSADRQPLSVCNIMFLCQHLGMAPEEGAYSRDKMSDPAYKPPLHFRLALRLQNGGRICGTLRYCFLPQNSCDKWSVKQQGMSLHWESLISSHCKVPIHWSQLGQGYVVLPRLVTMTTDTCYQGNRYLIPQWIYVLPSQRGHECRYQIPQTTNMGWHRHTTKATWMCYQDNCM